MKHSLQITSQGNGMDLVLIHGWGMHSGVWTNVQEELVHHFRVHCVDLPGHGKSYRSNSEFKLDQVARDIFQQLDIPADKKVHLIGWSLGGIVASKMASFIGGQLASLVLVATNLCFTQKEDWPYAMQKETLQEFAQFLMEQPEETLQQFLGLQVYGQKNARETLRELRQHILDQPSAEVEALMAGLEILLETDLRETAKSIQHPVFMISGEKDRLVPPASQKESEGFFANAKSHIIQNAGHAVFLSQHEDFMKRLTGFLNNVKAT